VQRVSSGTINPLNQKLLQIHKISVRTSKKTHFSIIKISWLIVFSEIIPVCMGNRTKPIHTNVALLVVKAGDK
jgi:hypothetical protein